MLLSLDKRSFSFDNLDSTIFSSSFIILSLTVCNVPVLAFDELGGFGKSPACHNQYVDDFNENHHHIMMTLIKATCRQVPVG